MRNSVTAMEPTVTTRVTAEVRAEAARQKATQDDIAQILGISQTQVSRRFTGQIDFGIDELAKLADAWGVPFSRLLPDELKVSAA